MSGLIDKLKSSVGINSSSNSHTELPPGDATLTNDETYRSKLTPEQFNIARKAGTERAFTGKYNDFKGIGIFHCICCDQPLFDSAAKFDSGSGWPSFWEKINPANVIDRPDGTGFMARTEVLCSKCHAHLGHVFNDGPRNKTGLRYCINSASLQFRDLSNKQQQHSDILKDTNNVCATK